MNKYQYSFLLKSSTQGAFLDLTKIIGQYLEEKNAHNDNIY